MTVETATYISDLNSTLPPGGDAKSEGDNHLRLIKAVLKTTLPNVTGAVNASHVELNYSVGVTSALQTQLNAKAPTANPTFTGSLTGATGTFSGSVTFGGVVSTAAVDFSGAITAIGPTPALASNGTALATTAFCQSLFASLTGQPSRSKAFFYGSM